MKKKRKIVKILSFFMMCVMALSMMAVSVHAADEGATPTPVTKTGTLTLKSNVTDETAKAQFEYSIYKIMDAYEVGTNAFDYDWTTDFADINNNDTYGKLTVDKVKNLKDGNTGHTYIPDTVDDITKYLVKYIKDKATISSTDAKIGATVNLAYGYYLIVDKTVPDGYKETKPMLVEISEKNKDITPTVKEQPLTIEKKIVDEEELKDSIASQVGKEITFRVTYDVPKYADDKNVTFYITDTLGKGLDFVEGSVKVYKDDAKNEENLLEEGLYEVREPEETDGEKTKVTFDFSSTEGKNYYTNVMDATDLIIEYKAKLNEDAEFGPAEGDGKNINEVVPTFGKDGKETHGKDDKTKSYSGKLEIIKKDDGGEKAKLLPGAEFTVYEANVDGTINETEPAELVVYSEKDGNPVKEIKDAVAVTDKDGKIRFDGLGEGTYYIKETNSPSGYIRLQEPIKITVEVAEPSIIETGNEKATFKYTLESTSDDVAMSQNDETGLLTLTVVNKEGFSLPTTGGMGTYLFTIGGIILMAAAVILFIRSRKKA